MAGVGVRGSIKLIQIVEREHLLVDRVVGNILGSGYSRLVLISCPAAATPMMILSPQPL